MDCLRFFPDELMLLSALDQDTEQSSGVSMEAVAMETGKSQTVHVPTSSRVHKISSRKKRIKKKSTHCLTVCWDPTLILSFLSWSLLTLAIYTLEAFSAPLCTVDLLYGRPNILHYGSWHPSICTATAREETASSA